MQVLPAVTIALALSMVAGAAAAQDTKSARSPGTRVPATLPAPPEGMGQIRFWRSDSMMGGALGCGVNIGSERISALGRGRYLLLNLDPGAYEFNAKSEAKDVLNLEVEPGEVQYVKCTIRMGVMVGRPNLSPSNEAEFNANRTDLEYVDSDDLGPRVLPDPGLSAPLPTEYVPEPAPAPVG